MSNHTESYKIVLTKASDKALRSEVVSKNAAAMIKSSINRSARVRGWDLEFNAHETLESTGALRDFYGITKTTRDINVMSMTLTYNAATEPITGDRASLVLGLAKKSQTPLYGSWFVTYVADAEGLEHRYEMPGDDEVAVDDAADLVGYAETVIPENWSDYFSHLYGLDAHIRRVRRAIEVGINSSWSKRFSVVLVGPPGCGKSDIAESVMRALQSTDEKSVWRLDGTATTAAGTIKELSELDILPRVIVMEEAEKANEKVTEPFLGILDNRGQVSKVTARGKVQRNARCITITTVNDYDKFSRMNAGALESRHTVKVFFDRPGRDTLVQILTREIHDVNGDLDWINPCLDYCEANGIVDVREVISHLLNGAEDWLDGSYVRDLKATAQAGPVSLDSAISGA